MQPQQRCDDALIEVRSFKWPQRPADCCRARLLGADEWGRWIGVAAGAPWWSADGTRSGVLDQPLVKLIPDGTFWTCCFHPVDPVVDVDVVLPVRWRDNVLEEVDLELDIVRCADGSTTVRDQDAFDRVRVAFNMPDEVAAQAQATCDLIRLAVERGAEPFASVGRAWLTRFLTEAR